MKRLRLLEWFGYQPHERDTNFFGSSKRGFPAVIIPELPIDVENGSPNYFIAFGNFLKKQCSEFPKDFIGIYDHLITLRAR